MNDASAQSSDYVAIAVDVRRALDVLSKNVFAGRRACLRELIANAADAISQLESESLGNVEIRVSPDPVANTLTITDTGIGMTQSEARRLLGTVFASSKSTDDGCVGEFGIGFYSCFPFCSRVEVLTKSRQEGEPSVRIVYAGGERLEVSLCEKTNPGTEVVLHLLPEHRTVLERDTLIPLIQQDCVFIPYPIYLGAGYEVLNALDAPWYHDDALESDAREALATHYGVEDAIVVIPVYGEASGMAVRGVIYVTPSDNKPVVRTYTRRTLIADQGGALFDDETAGFVSAVVDAVGLPLVISRNAIVSDAPEVGSLRDYLGERLASGLARVAKTDKVAFRHLFAEHGRALKQACLEQPTIRKAIGDHIPFRSSVRTHVTISDYLASNPDDAIIYADDLSTAQALLPLYSRTNREVLFMTDPVDRALRMNWRVGGREIEFRRLDTDPPIENDDGGDGISSSREKVSGSVDAAVKMLFQQSLGDDVNLEIGLKTLGSDSPPSVLSLDEEGRRALEMSEALRRYKSERRLNELPAMMRMAADNGLLDIIASQTKQTLILNQSHRLIQSLLGLLGDKGVGRYTVVALLARFLYSQALAASGLSISPEKQAEVARDQTDLIADLIGYHSQSSTQEME